ncbi:MAG TPA: hypothetical protein VFI47_06105, partial [Acidimicrobiales bacterium]|nr:hypothetical protein [Acidimicrobiales bacterium]
GTTGTPKDVPMCGHATDLPAPGEGDPRFNVALVIAVARVIEEHGYDPLNGGQVVELQQHLHHLLHGCTEGTCAGGVA